MKGIWIQFSLSANLKSSMFFGGVEPSTKEALPWHVCGWRRENCPSDISCYSLCFSALVDRITSTAATSDWDISELFREIADGLIDSSFRMHLLLWSYYYAPGRGQFNGNIWQWRRRICGSLKGPQVIFCPNSGICSFGCEVNYQETMGICTFFCRDLKSYRRR